MKKLLLTFLALSSSLLAFSQGTWTSRDTLPDSAMVQGISGFSINGYGYVGLGEYGPYNKYFNSLWQFNPTTNSWVKKASFTGSARVAPACFVICDMAYVVCGSVKNAGACVNECWEYDATNNTWTQKANFPGPVRTYAVGFAIDSLGYVGTGANELSDFRKDFYAYHPSTNTWTKIADFGGVPRDGTCGLAVNGKGYVCFGQDSTEKTLKDIWAYDPIANTWTQKSSYPGPGLLGESGFAICDNIYIGSGDSTAGLLATDHRFWKYNTVSDFWTQESDVPRLTKAYGDAFSIGDTGYYGFGSDSNGYARNIFDKFYGGDNCPIISNCNSASINEISPEERISVYPNPSNGKFTLEISNSIIEDRNIIEVYNMFGIKVYTSYLTQTLSEINLSNQPPGAYICRVTKKDGSLVGKRKILIK
jgi:N-acetylneuraminic acid mutarotase